MKELIRGRVYIFNPTYTDIEPVKFIKMVDDGIGALVRARILFFWGPMKLVRAECLIGEWP